MPAASTAPGRPDAVDPEPQPEMQYSSMRHQSVTAVDGMWLFLASEMLFFGGLLLAWLITRHWHGEGFRLAAAHSNLTIGTANTFVLLTSGMAYAAGQHALERTGEARRHMLACLATMGLGALFLALKGVEWWKDIAEGLVPGPGFALHGPDGRGAQLFYVLYWTGTIIHALHMLAGIGLVGWIWWRLRRSGEEAPHSAVEAVGLYWAFVDVVWLTLFPVIYLVDR